MYYLILVYPTFFSRLKILRISRYMNKNSYNFKIKRIFYRIKSRLKDNNPRKIFIKGDGKVYTYELPPHCTLIMFEATESHFDSIKKEIHRIATNSAPFHSKLNGIGGYGDDFTLFVELDKNPELIHLRNSLYESFKKYLKSGKQVEYKPHITLLYDDFDSNKIKKARDLLKDKKIDGQFYVNKIYLVLIENFKVKKFDKFRLLKRIK